MFINIIKNMSEAMIKLYKYFFKNNNKNSNDHDEISNRFIIDEEEIIF